MQMRWLGSCCRVSAVFAKLTPELTLWIHSFSSLSNTALHKMGLCKMQRQVSGSKLIDTRDKLEKLATLLNVDARLLKLTTLFSTRTNGWSPAAFHSLCDNKGPSLTIVQDAGGSLYGGYTSISWTSSTGLANDSKAFLFRSESSGSGNLESIKRSGNGNEIFQNAEYGPVFGCKHDFFTFDNKTSILREQSYQGSYAYDADYGCTRHKKCLYNSFSLDGTLITSKLSKTDQNFQLEVLQIGQFDPAEGELEQPWLSGAATAWSDIVSYFCCYWSDLHFVSGTLAR